MLQIDKEKLNLAQIDDIEVFYDLVDFINKCIESAQHKCTFRDAYQIAIDVLVDQVDDGEVNEFEAFNMLASLNNYQRHNRELLGDAY